MTLTTENLCVTIGKKPIVQDVNLRAAQGEWWMLLGPNGAGKTTLLTALAGTRGYTGRALLEDADLRTLSIRERAARIGVLSQNSGIAAGFTVQEVVAMGRYSHRRGVFGADEPDLTARVAQAMELTGVTALRHQSMLTLSGGERQRAFLAQVLCQDPQVLLLDEPANHLDLIYQKQMFELIDRWRTQPGKLVIAVVHDLDLARRFGTHALVMDHGRAVAAGPIGEVLTDDTLNRVWRMDVRAWRDGLHSAWE